MSLPKPDRIDFSQFRHGHFERITKAPLFFAGGSSDKAIACSSFNTKSASADSESGTNWMGDV